MNSIASPRRTEFGLGGAVPLARLSTAYAALLLTVLIVTFRPFQPAGGEGAAEGGDIVNQLGFSSLGGLAVIGILCLAEPRKISLLFGPSWVLLLSFLAIGVANAAEPAAAFRASFFTLMAMATVLAALIIPRDADAFSTVLAVAGLVVIGVSYFGLVALPGTAIHTSASAEPQHAGLWRGLFPHKNVAGPVMACFSFAGFYLLRRGWPRIGLVMLVAAMIFMANTGSKTTAGLVPLAIGIVILPGLIGMRPLTIALFALAIVGTGVATLGMVFIDPVGELILSYFPDLTYTGRTTLWEYAGEMIAKRPWTGYGFDSFWGSKMLLGTDKPFDSAWDIRTIVHGHNSYLDIALTLGLPATVVAIIALLVAPARDYLRVPRLKENIYLADLFMMIVLFTSLNAFLESFFFRRADPVWMFLVLGAFGLRLVARMPVPSSSRR
ncbi:MAG TPA: O-antigen ligase family protein [Rhizobiales bacterium]|nr:O-antigen ligase family protein [Hyphomicrobiales bacterium]